jgi:hypothetical protein
MICLRPSALTASCATIFCSEARASATIRALRASQTSRKGRSISCTRDKPRSGGQYQSWWRNIGCVQFQQIMGRACPVNVMGAYALLVNRTSVRA